MLATPNAYEAGETARRFLLEGMADLARSDQGSSAFEADRRDFLAWLRDAQRRDNALIEELGRQGKGSQVTLEVIRKLQQQADDVQQQSERRGAFPWNVRWQYFKERSPLGFRGQYSQGRSVVELLLTPDPRAKDSWLNKIGPLNLAAGFDLV
eukprot:TRINITY_DN3051_c0_g2_i3.p6 TRINITY_DN3051_c0_g2~~TRINITY_DN3051_c0_g2_i3.p6  ORF type:complete len:153 (-),score=36.73 TRINITY_DN3051_c0_g2_i3:41-499(-)